jgi:26S proteasome regulatory subunit N11
MDRLNRMLQAAQGMGMGGGAPGGVSQMITPISPCVSIEAPC